MLEAPAASVEERFGVRGRTTTLETSNSAGCVVLVEAEPCGIELLEHNEAIDHINVGHLLGKAFDCSSKAVRSRV